MNEDTIEKSIFYICVASVLICWSITSHYEKIEELKNEKETLSEAFEKGYIQCVENNTTNASFTKAVWKKECK